MKFDEFLTIEKQQDYFKKLIRFVNDESFKYTVYPPSDEVFSAFRYTDLEKVKVVIIGQDPYHQKGQANGLAFSVKQGVVLPPSLRNIFKELEDDLGIKNTSGDLTSWSKQNVLLLNTTLTVTDSSPMSHKGQGWEEFTRKIVRLVSDQNERVIFVLWGNHAQQLLSEIDMNKHMIIKSAHPSPLSAHRGFFGSKVFSRINNELENPIDWRTI